MKRPDGFYWIKQREDDEWEVAEWVQEWSDSWDAHGWLHTGHEVPLTEPAIVGPILSPPHKP